MATGLLHPGLPLYQPLPIPAGARFRHPGPASQVEALQLGRLGGVGCLGVPGVPRGPRAEICNAVIGR